MESDHTPNKSSRLLNKGLLDSLKRYEKLRRAGRHDGPPLQDLRLYRVKGYPEAGLKNVDRPDDHNGGNADQAQRLGIRQDVCTQSPRETV